MEAIQNATQAELEIFPAILCAFFKWMTDQGMKLQTASSYARYMGNLVDQDGKSAIGMASDAYYQLVRASERNKRCNQALQSSVKKFIDFWRGRADEPWPDPGSTPRFKVTRQVPVSQEPAGQREPAPPNPSSPPRKPAEAATQDEAGQAGAPPKPKSPPRPLADASVAEALAQEAAQEKAESDAAKPGSGDSSQVSCPVVSKAESKEVDSALPKTESKEVDSSCAPVKRGLSLEEDAPKSSAAWGAIKHITTAASPYFQFTFKEASGRKQAFQVTVRMAGGDAELAFRICRLCYARFEAGAGKEEVTVYRNDLFQTVSRGAEPKEASGGRGEAGEGKRPSKASEKSQGAEGKAAEKPKGAEGSGKKRKVEATKEKKKKKKKVQASKSAAANEESAKERARSSSSSSSSSSSDSSDESKAREAREAAAARQRSLVAEGPGKPRGQLATKMSVRTGMRCSCHFTTSCPDRP